MSLNFYDEEEDNDREESVDNYKYLFSNYETNIPTLKEALIQLFKSSNIDDSKTNDLTQDILDKCKNIIDKKFDQIKQKNENLTLDDAYIICSYTCESKDDKYSPYRILNQNLVSKDRKKGIEKISKYFFIFLKSLRKLKRYYPTKEKKYLYRSITHEVCLSKDPFNDKLVPYISGNKKTFWGFTSTSYNPKTTYNFLKTKEKIKSGTVFTLGGDIWGYDISLFNYFGEEEILLEPERKFIVDNVLPPLNGIISINCKLIKTKLILDEDEIGPNMLENYIKPENSENNYDKIDKFSELNNYIVKIEMEVDINYVTNFKSGIGIFCSVPSKNIKILITYNNLIDYDCLNKIKKLIVHQNGEEKEINMKSNRYKYNNKKDELTIIEILKEDNIYNFIEIDKFINSKNYINESLLFLTLKDFKQLQIKEGKADKMYYGNYLCFMESLKEGIVILKDNLKLIGLIKEHYKKDKIEIIPMNLIIEQINFIKCKYEINKNDLGKEIQILNDSCSININNESYIIGNGCNYSDIDIIINSEIKRETQTYKFNKEGIYTVYLILNNRNLRYTHMHCLLSECSKLIEVDLTSFDTSIIMDMAALFCGCISLKKIILSSFNTSQVEDMSFMFSACTSLKKINLSSFDTRKVQNMDGMFFCCSSLEEINLSNFDTGQVTSMNFMFAACLSLKELNLLSFNTSNLIEMKCIFNECTSLKKLNLTSFDTSKVKDMSYVFCKCSSLKNLDLSSFHTQENIYIKKMFIGCTSLKKVDTKDKNIQKAFKDDKNCCII